MKRETFIVDGLAIPVGEEGLPDESRIRRMNEAALEVCAILEPHGGKVTHSPLGPGWSSDLDVYVAGALDEPMIAADNAGWVPLDGLNRHLGYPGRGRWAVVASDRILAGADIRRGDAPDETEALRNRIARKGGVALREALEIRHLARTRDAESVAGRSELEAAAAIEVRLGGRELRAWHTPDGSEAGSTRSRRTAHPHWRTAGVRRALRPRLRIALSGVDGSGKSSLTTGLREFLENCGLESSIVWTRPGMRLQVLDGIGRFGKRVLGVRRDGLADLAAGAEPRDVRSRRGAIGWLWSVLITVAYLWDVRRRSLAAPGSVVIYDRHLLDAIATMEAFYEGVNTRFQVWLIRHLIPRADVSIWLDVPAEVSVERKPDELFNRRMVEKQIERYRANAGKIHRLVRIDGTEPATEVAMTSFRSMADMLTERTPGHWARFVAWIRSRR